MVSCYYCMNEFAVLSDTYVVMYLLGEFLHRFKLVIQNFPSHWVWLLHLFHQKNLFTFKLMILSPFIFWSVFDVMPSIVCLRFCQCESVGLEHLNFFSYFYLCINVVKFPLGTLHWRIHSWLALLEMFLANCRCRDSTTGSWKHIIGRR